MILILLVFHPPLSHEFPNDLARRAALVVSAGVHYRMGVASRAVAAIAGGYGVAALSAAVLALGLPVLFDMARSEAALTGTLASFLVYAVAVMWVFAARSAWRAWAGLGIAAALQGLLLLLWTQGGGGAA